MSNKSKKGQSQSVSLPTIQFMIDLNSKIQGVVKDLVYSERSAESLEQQKKIIHNLSFLNEVAVDDCKKSMKDRVERYNKSRTNITFLDPVPPPPTPPRVLQSSERVSVSGNYPFIDIIENRGKEKKKR